MSIFLFATIVTLTEIHFMFVFFNHCNDQEVERLKGHALHQKTAWTVGKCLLSLVSLLDFSDGISGICTSLKLLTSIDFRLTGDNVGLRYNEAHVD